jgi:hypothetical protein
MLAHPLLRQRVHLPTAPLANRHHHEPINLENISGFAIYAYSMVALMVQCLFPFMLCATNVIMNVAMSVLSKVPIKPT